MNILNFTEAASLAIHTMTILAANPEKLVSAGQIAESLGVSEAHLAKVLQRLAKAGLVKSVRGPNGGFRMARVPEEVRLSEVYEVIEGPIPHSSCLLGRKVCEGECIFDGLIGTMRKMFAEYLRNTYLANITTAFTVKTKGEE